MALRSSLRLYLQVKQKQVFLPHSSVCASKLFAYGDSRSRRYGSSFETRNKNYQAKWTVPISICLTAFGGLILMRWNEEKHRFIPTVSAAQPFDGPGSGSGSGSIRQNFNFVADVVEKVAPSVVSLHTVQVMGGFKEISAASGFIVSSDGLIVTNAHAVANKTTIQVELIDGRLFEGRVETIDQKTDLATVRIPAKNLPILKLGSSDTLRPGEWVISIGSPAGLSNSVSCGVVSTVGRKSQELRLHSGDIEYIQTDAPINQGNSGGPLVNLDGEAVGVNSMKLLHGISFAIPSNVVKDFLEDPTKTQKSSPKKRTGMARNIGITCLTLNPYLRSEIERHFRYNINASHGVYIVDVHPLSPAMRAGLKGGDVIVAVNNNPIKSTDELYETTTTNSVLFATVIRGGAKIGLKIELD